MSDDIRYCPNCDISYDSFCGEHVCIQTVKAKENENDRLYGIIKNLAFVIGRAGVIINKCEKTPEILVWKQEAIKALENAK